MANFYWGNILNFVATWPKILSLCLGSLLVLALPPYFQFWAMFFAFSGALFLCARTTSRKHLAVIGYLFGFAYYAIGFYWIGNALLVDPEKTGWMYIPVLMLNGAFFGLFTILPFVATQFGKNIVAKILLFAATWCIFNEYVREYIFTGFPWNPVGSMLAFRPKMLQTLTLWGTNGLSLIAVFLASFSAIWLVRPNRKTFVSVILTLIAVIGIWEYGDHVFNTRPQIPDGHSLMIRLVQPSILQSLKWDREALENNLQAYINLSKEKTNQYIDFIIWGETASSFDLTADNKHRDLIRKIIPKRGYLITGFLRIEDGENGIIPYNSFGVLNSKGEIVATYDKNHLVPFGEYVPFRKYLPQWVKPVVNVVAEFGQGIKHQTIKIADYPAFAPLICYEMIFSGEVLSRTTKPQWIVVLTNDGWYGNSSGPYQHLVAAKMRAVEEGVSVVRSANNGISAVITPYGTIRKHLPLNARGFIDALVKPDEARTTLFGQYGNIIPILMSLIFYLCAALINILDAKFRRKN